MKFSLTRIPTRILTRTTAIFVVVVCIAASLCAAQKLSFTPPAQQQTGPQNLPPNGQVIFSRSTDENGQPTGQTPAPQNQTATEPTAADAERQAVTFTDFDMDVRLRTAAQQIAVRALVAVRNDGKTPLARVPLEISSSLNWERIRVGGKDMAFPVATLNSDADHTGQLHEAAVPLAQPLAPGQTIQLDVTYSGTIAPSAQRLLAIGTPEDVALHSDWDGIGIPFTGLRGFGNVVWYPVSAVPVILGDGARLFDEIGEHKLRIAGARFHLRLTVEFPHGHAPTVALINGHAATLTVTDAESSGAEVSGVATADSGATTLGFEAPSLFAAIRTAHAATNTTVWALPENEVAVSSWTAAVSDVTPFLQGWLGQRPRAQLTLLDLPDPQDTPFETGGLLGHHHSAGRRGAVERHPGPCAYPRVDAVSPRLAQRGSGSLHGHVVGGEAKRPRAGLGDAGVRARRTRPGRAGKPRPKPGTALGLGSFARLFPHQGHLCSVDAEGRGWRRHALSRSEGLRSHQGCSQPGHWKRQRPQLL